MGAKGLCLAAVLLLPLAIGSTHAQDHARHEQPSDAHAEAEVATPAQRWQADDPLREGMARVQSAHHALSGIDRARLDAAAVREQAVAIAAAVDDIFARCRLEPQPDAALHPLLARLIAASQALRKDPADAAPITEIRAVLDRYALLFDDDSR